MRPTIRRATAADLAALIALERAFPGDRLSPRSFRHLLRRGRADVLVAVVDRRLVANAVVLYRKTASAARLYSLVVDPRYRGRGIARMLVAAAEGAAARCGARSLRLEVRCDNTVALGLYRGLGYRLVQRVAGYYEDGCEALRLERALESSRRPAAQAA